ncbi:MAG: GIY-YIG nuclease family protein [Candidatus Omnitrophota bacterium]|nr:GIY-YIG nuclease family protein [Candidatus Omnitrophota bacterium]MBU1928562.1 GIY-YIG nuclease family protein [Candidatus Omnitrophota bacterium]MBU2034575.1 GIY-YIG nuclease family protein [Candidatus Omnitrophota bacterium]
MYFVYILKSENHNFIYTGSTPDLNRRILEHNRGVVESTKFYVPLEFVYYEAYRNKEDALVREHKLKHHGSVIGHLKKRLKYSLSI